MNHETFPEIRVATDTLESRIAITEGEVEELKKTIAGKKALLRSWRKALATFNPRRAGSKKRGTVNHRKAAGEALSTA